jgi:hypothetical protein
MLDAPVADAARGFLNPFEFDPWEVIGSVLPDVLDLAALHAIRPTVQAVLQALDSFFRRSGLCQYADTATEQLLIRFNI